MVPPRLLAANALLLLTLLGSYRATHLENSAPSPLTGDQKRFLERVDLGYRGWKTTDHALSVEEIENLEPDATLIRRYHSPEGRTIELAVIVGHQKRNIHTPGYCMPSTGWEFVSQHGDSLKVAGGSLPIMRAIVSKEQTQLLLTYFFTDGETVTPSLDRFLIIQQLKRLRGERPLGALIRILTPVDSQTGEAEKFSDAFTASLTPTLMASMRSLRQKR